MYVKWKNVYTGYKQKEINTAQMHIYVWLYAVLYTYALM